MSTTVHATVIHVAVAVIVNERDEVCISLRHQDSHQGGLWEFPGGKLEGNETVEQALAREIKEELGLQIERSRPLITISHDYGDKKVCLHVQKILSFNGQASGLEGQQVKWVSASDLSACEFPTANAAIIEALQLPEKYLITGKFVDLDDFSDKLKNALDKNIRLVQLRLKKDSLKDHDQTQVLLEQASRLCQRVDAKLMLNMSEDHHKILDLSQITFAGFHADSRLLNSLSTKKIPFSRAGKWLSASCHNSQELQQALNLKADFVVLSPVQKTASHPDMIPMGWQKFSDMVSNMTIPVYALGGVTESDMEVSWLHGAQGIAAISAFWGLRVV